MLAKLNRHADVALAAGVTVAAATPYLTMYGTYRALGVSGAAARPAWLLLVVAVVAALAIAQLWSERHAADIVTLEPAHRAEPTSTGCRVARSAA